MDDDWDDAALNEQVRLLRQQCQGQLSGAPTKALAGKRPATESALGLGQGRSRRRTSDMRSAAPAAAASSAAAVARARSPRLAHTGTGHCHGASAQLAPRSTRRGALDHKAAAAQTSMSKTKADKAKERAAKAKAKAKAKADKAKEAKANKATTTAKATAHSSEARVAPTAAALLNLSVHAGGVPRIIRVGTECSGMEPVAMALRNLGVLDQCSLEFCCEINKWCKSFILQNHPPKNFFDDITLRDPETTPPCDLYVAGFPCQPFSRAGLRQGANDAQGRGSIFKHIVKYLRAHRPRAVILENVAGLKDDVFGETFNNMLAALRGIKGNGHQSYYLVSKRLVDTAKWGLPHSRKRIYIVCLSQEAMRTSSAPFFVAKAIHRLHAN